MKAIADTARRDPPVRSPARPRGHMGAVAAPLALLALLALVPAAPTGALAQEADGADLGEIAEELRRLRAEVRDVEFETALLYVASLGVGVAIAVIAFLATRANTARLAEQGRLFRERLDLLKTEMERRLLPALAWRMLDNDDPIKVSGKRGRLGHLTISVINSGQGAAVDVVVHHHARIVGAGTAPRPSVRSLGTLAPGESRDIPIPMSMEDIGSVMGGGMAYVEAVFEHRDGEGNEMAYRVVGYRSGAISTLFGEKVAVPRASGSSEAAPAAVTHAPGEGELSAESRRIQSAGSHARGLAMSQEPRDSLGQDEAGRLLAACDQAIGRDAQDHVAHRERAAALRILGQHRMPWRR